VEPREVRFECKMRPVSQARRIRVKALSLVGLAFQASGFAAGATGAFLSPSGGGRLEPGAEVAATWTLDSSAIGKIDEAELVLSLDGGQTFPVRLTARISPDSRTSEWRVPALPTEHARIALRVGNDEEPGAENLLFLSEPFAIASARNLPREQLFWFNGEWRTREAIAGAPARPMSRDVGSSGSDLTLNLLDVEAEGLRRGPTPIPLTGGEIPLSHPCPPPDSREAIRSAISLKATLPLRL